MPPKVRTIDMVGKRFGKLTVISLHHAEQYQRFWDCICDCGKTKIVEGAKLRSGNTASCGCLRGPKVKTELRGRLGYRICSNCRIEQPLDDAHFWKDKGKEDGRSFSCISCQNTRKNSAYADNPHSNWSQEIRTKKREYSNKYRKTIVGRSVHLMKQYRKIDSMRGREFNLTREYIMEQIINPCVFCGETDHTKIGLDRIDSSIGHTIHNCQPCCKECNIAKCNHFSHFEMLQIGQVIKSIKEQRRLLLQ